MNLNLLKARTEYFGRGFTVLPDVAPQRLINEWAQASLDAMGAGEGFRRDTDGATDGVERHFTVLSGHVVLSRMPSLYGAYAGWLSFLRAITGEPVVLSNYDLSAVNVRIYHGAQATLGWHYDSQPVTALLYLTTHKSEGATEVHPADNPDGPVTSCWPEAGSMLLMQGRRCLHRAAGISGLDVRMAVALNYYLVGDTYRERRLDVLHYGEENLGPAV